MPKPVLQAMVLADHVYQDRSTGKYVIAGTFTNLFFGKQKVVPLEGDQEGRQVLTGPITLAGSPYLYFALVEVHGQTPLDLKFVDLSDASVQFECSLVVTARDPLIVAEYMMPIPMLPANKIGQYSLDLLHDGEILGSWRISVMEAPLQSGDEETEQ